MVLILIVYVFEADESGCYSMDEEVKGFILVVIFVEVEGGREVDGENREVPADWQALRVNTDAERERQLACLVI
jgi:hypothetical protein